MGTVVEKQVRYVRRIRGGGIHLDMDEFSDNYTTFHTIEIFTSSNRIHCSLLL